jgi:hypothetical protein
MNAAVHSVQEADLPIRTCSNSIATRNARLAAIRSFFHHVAAADPASFGVAQRVLTIPTKRAHIEVTHHLTNAEVGAIVAPLIRRRPAAGATGPFCSSWRELAPACPKRLASTRTTFTWNEGARKFCSTARDAEIALFPFLWIWCDR